MAKGLGAFAEGMLNGFVSGKKNQREQELHDLQVARLKDERAMQQEFKQLDTTAQPREGYVLTTPDGTRTVFADESMANEAKNAFGDNARLDKKFIVGANQFDTADQAQTAVDAANAPAVKLRQRAEIALKYNRPDLADAYTKNYNNTLEMNRRDMTESFLQAQQTGDFNAVMDAYNKRLPNGVSANITRNEQGGLTMEVMKNGKVVSQKPFADDASFWNTMGQQVASTPDNMLEIWKTREGLALQGRAVATQEKQTDIQARKVDADIRNDDRRLGQGDRGLDIQERATNANITHQAGMLGVARQNAGTAAGGLVLQQFHETKPTVVSGFDPKTNEAAVSATRPYLAPDGTWKVEVMPAQTLRGLAPMPMASETIKAANNPLNQLGLGGAQQPLVIDWTKVPPKNLGNSSTPQSPAYPPNHPVNQIPR